MVKWFLLLCWLNSSMLVHAMTPNDIQPYLLSDLTKMRLQLADIEPLIQHYGQHPDVSVQQLGRSVEDRPIYLLQLGQGEKRILAWSQMHGDEHTATAALFDLLNYTLAPEQTAWRELLFSKITLYLVPMLNPDGAARNSRVNAQGIDINRDALALQSPEGQILMELARKIQPHYGFNLHDQNRFHAAGEAPNPATISLLAPAYNASREINDSRRHAMQLIAYVQPWLEQQLPQHLGRYNDTWSPRSFGDTFASMGIRTVLVEAGGHRADDLRQVARRVNVQLYLAWLDAIASESYRQAPLSAYEAIPFNRSGGMKDLILQNVQVTVSGHTAILDIGVHFHTEGDSNARIQELGDLTGFGAYHLFDLQGQRYQAGRAYPLSEPLLLDDQRYQQLLRQGYSHFSGDAKLLQRHTRLPVLVNPLRPTQLSPQLRQGATFLLLDNQGEVVQVLLNGQLVNLANMELRNPLGT